jgi:hypothetical protein
MDADDVHVSNRGQVLIWKMSLQGKKRQQVFQNTPLQVYDYRKSQFLGL